MIFERIKSEGIAHNSYFIASGGIAAVIDPRRDIEVYLNLAVDHEVRLKYILETHRNEDYVIGSSELAAATGAEIYHGPRSDWKYGQDLKDGQEFNLGKIKISALHTPGHTDESISYILTDLSSGGAPVMIFTGDTLFVGDTGRIDLYGPSEVSRLASNLYDSLFNKILPLGGSVIFCPAHGAGSLCGSHIASREESTLGIELLQGPALQHKNREDFIRYKAAEKLERPPYFLQMEKLNLEGAPVLHNLPIPAALSAAEFKAEMAKGAIVVDTSLPAGFGGAHIKGAYSMWLEGLPGFAGWFLPYDKDLILVMEDKRHLDQAVRYLIRLGYDRIKGYLREGIEGWYDAGFEVEKLPLLSVQELKQSLEGQGDLLLLDVRDQEEWDEGHVAGAKHIYVGHLEKRLAEIPPNKPVVTFCSVGHRAGIAGSILLRAGFPVVYSVLGSMTAWKKAGYLIVKDIQPVK